MKKYNIIKIIGIIILGNILIKFFFGDISKIIGVNLSSTQNFLVNSFNNLSTSLINIIISLFISYILFSILASLILDIFKELKVFIKSFKKEIEE